MEALPTVHCFLDMFGYCLATHRHTFVLAVKRGEVFVVEEANERAATRFGEIPKFPPF